MLESDQAGAEALFDGRITFGTAGLRASMGPGPKQMNRLVVRQTTAGVMSWLPDGATVVIGYDARHDSATYAQEVAAVVGAAGGHALVLPAPLPTPVLAYAVLDRRADAGVMITASHNPAADNGYKLYLGDGIQLVDPADAEIAAAITAVAARHDQSIAGLVASDGSEGPISPEAGTIVTLDEAMAARHLQAAVAACRGQDREVKTLYTAMHGVGGRHLLAAFAAAGCPPPVVVDGQFDPGPDFSTVAFPNPEEPGALDLAFATAQEEADAGRPVDVILANDPDADRLGVAIPDRHGIWTRLSGDQVGVLLADHLLGHSSGPDRLVASSLVSSRLITAMAEDVGATSIRTLTGFKWVARPIVERPKDHYLLGYEEALGYCVGDRVRDKDGISAALVMAELVAETVAAGETLWDRLDHLAQRHGVYLTAPVTLVFAGTGGSERRQRLLQQVQSSPPIELAGVEITGSEDLSLGHDLPPASGLIWHLADRSRVVIRPSGTEPKLKAYLEVIEPIGQSSPADAQQRAASRMAALESAVSALFAV
ncbi:MAG: phospho-sugar mutase [Actinomycetia bacterium]|nr:phospho-sugar mutase [Actinomycetes bacterium]